MKTALSAVALAAVLAIAPLAGGTFAAPEDSARQHGHFTAEDRAAFLDARIAALKAGLELNADQEKNSAGSRVRDAGSRPRSGRPVSKLGRRAAGRTDMSPVDRLAHASDAVERPRGWLAETRRRRQAALRQPRREPRTPLRHPFHHGPQPLAPLAPRTRRLKRSLKPGMKTSGRGRRPRGLPRFLRLIARLQRPAAAP